MMETTTESTMETKPLGLTGPTGINTGVRSQGVTGTVGARARNANPIPMRRGVLPVLRREKTPRRNELCPCGSGKKAKRCCLNKIKLLASLPPHVRQDLIVSRLLQPRMQTIPLPVADAFARTGSDLGTTEVPLEKAEIENANP
jgi:hypothetical protein